MHQIFPVVSTHHNTCASGHVTHSQDACVVVGPILPSVSAAQRSAIVCAESWRAEGLTLNRGGCAPLRRLFCLLLLTWETPLLTLSKLNQQFRNCHPNIQEYLLKRLHLCSYSVFLPKQQNAYFWIQTICYDSMWFPEQNSY